MSMNGGSVDGSGWGMTDSDDLAERGTAEFYREQVSRLMRLAETMHDPATRIELLDIASVFQKLAERATALTEASARKSA